jgi:signal transduction histidine kinase
MRHLRLFSYQMLFSHVGVAVLTTLTLVTVLVVILNQGVTLHEYEIRAMIDYTAWQFDDRGVIDTFSLDPSGYGIVVDENNTVVFVEGDTPCDVGSQLSACLPSLNDLSAGASYYDSEGEQWVQVVLATKTGQRVISQRGPYESALNLGETSITGYVPIIFVQTVLTMLIALPIALIFAVAFVRPQVRRIDRVARVSRAFASGDFDARVHDSRVDEVGQLGQQFDDMADALQQNFAALRELAQRNAELAQQVEQSAINSERIRLSRDLHDSIAQTLFSLSVSTRALPDIIESDGRRGAVGAEKLADLAEQTLEDLRSILVDLRPAAVISQGVASALRQLCDDWESQYQVSLTCTLLLTGRRIPAAIEDVVFRVTQEALNNVARYAQADSASVTLVEGREQISLSISDDGVGFDSQTAQEQGHFGIIGMRERVMAIGGLLNIGSSPSGTTIEAIIPIEKAE